jgi:septal ring factor EnvC (AmiA/AmiB activator)
MIGLVGIGKRIKRPHDTKALEKMIKSLEADIISLRHEAYRLEMENRRLRQEMETECPRH